MLAPAVRLPSVIVALLGALSFFVILSVGGVRAQALESLTIATVSGEHVFQVEIAKDDASRSKGLMFRRAMPADRGMLFEFDVDAPVSFWMKNTYLPLDMVFIAPDGRVTRVAANAAPLSEAIIPSGAPCIAVLEINAGIAARIGLAVGDRVVNPFFHP